MRLAQIVIDLNLPQTIEWCVIPPQDESFVGAAPSSDASSFNEKDQFFFSKALCFVINIRYCEA